LCGEREQTQKEILQFVTHIVQIWTTAREKRKNYIDPTCVCKEANESRKNDIYATDAAHKLRLCHCTIAEYTYIEEQEVKQNKSRDSAGRENRQCCCGGSHLALH
jgi:hypothetical protein